MQLVSLHLTDFQVHKDLRIKFVPGITTIVGATDQGKSSILRALRWVCLNDMSGEQFIRKGMKKTRIVLVVHAQPDTKKNPMAWEVVREKGRGGNLNEYELDTKVFRSFGTNVPSDIEKLLQLNGINFQNQHDSPFWFSDTPGEVSRQLNSVIDLSVIDTTLSNIGAEVRKAQERKGLCEERLKSAQDQLQKLEGQQERIDAFAKLKGYHDKHFEIETRESQLEALLERVGSNEARSLRNKAAQSAYLLSIAREAVKLSRKAEALDSTLGEIRSLTQAACSPPSIDPLDRLFLEQQVAIGDLEGFEELLEELGAAEKRCEDTAVLLQSAERHFTKATKGARCPTCHQRLPQ